MRTVRNWNLEKTQIEINKSTNSKILLGEYMLKLGITDGDLELNMSEIKAKIRDNKISKIIK